MRRARILSILGVTAAAVLFFGLARVATHPGPTTAITAHFPDAPGVYVGNLVKVLGVPVGHITAIHTGPDDVSVDITVTRSTKIPVDAVAVLMAPNVVSDRFIQLSPAYSGGPAMQDGFQIATDHTRLPVAIDQITASLDTLAKAFGPSGADQNGNLQSLLHNLAANLAGSGQPLHDTITGLSQALGAVASNGQQAASTISSLDQLAQSVSANTGLVSSFASNVASVAGELGGDRGDLGSALSALQVALGQLAGFVRTNQASLGQTVANLNTAVAAVANHQQALVEAYDVGPLALQNFGAVDAASYPGGAVGRARLDLIPGVPQLVSQLCGNPELHAVNVLTKMASGNPWDVLCLALNGVDTEPPPPGAPTIPNLTLSALIGGAS